MRFKLSQFFCWDLATGAKVIGSLGVLKHSLVILFIYLATIDLWVLSNEKEGQKISTLLFTIAVMLLFIGLVVNVINIVLSYRLFKILDTNHIQDLTSWINAERIYLTLFTIYFFSKLWYSEFDVLKHFTPVVSFAFDVYCYLCVMSLREDYVQRSSLLAQP